MQLEGKKLGGRYEIISRLGGGGMAVVYKAFDHSLGRYVALKVLSESLSNDNEFVRRFSREAQAAASLSHPSIVNVYDVGKDGYTYYIVMELVEGPTLKQYIRQKEVLPPEEAGMIAVKICDGLAHAHENQIVHRDIKPHNILLDQKGGRVKVTDFGIARAASSSTITQKGAVMGSVHYFSPEQARGGLTGEKSDIYSLGVVLFEMLTGELPFDGDQAISIALMHLQNPVPDPRSINPDIPDNFAKIVMRAMEKEPDMRYSSILAMKKDLQSALMMLPKQVNTDDLFITVPMTAIDDDDSILTSNNSEMTQKPLESSMNVEEKDPFANKEQNSPWNQEYNNSPRRYQVADSKDQETDSTPEDEKELTVFQKTAIWIENAQEKLTWWQKGLFGVITIVLIISLAVFGFNMVMGWFSAGGSPDAESGQSNTEQTAGAQNQENSDEDLVEVKNYIGRYQEGENTGVDKEVPVSEEKNGYKLDINRSRCYNDDLGKGLQHGQILDQYPKAGEKIPRGSTVYLWIYAPKSPGCKSLPPTLGGKP